MSTHLMIIAVMLARPRTHDDDNEPFLRLPLKIAQLRRELLSLANVDNELFRNLLTLNEKIEELRKTTEIPKPIKPEIIEKPIKPVIPGKTVGRLPLCRNSSLSKRVAVDRPDHMPTLT